MAEPFRRARDLVGDQGARVASFSPAEAAAPLPREPATITPYRDGPLLVRGSFQLVDTDGEQIDPGRDIVALCRCGKSALKPFCDGSHIRAGFRAPSRPNRLRPSELLGQDETPMAPSAPTVEGVAPADGPGSGDRSHDGRE